MTPLHHYTTIHLGTLPVTSTSPDADQSIPHPPVTCMTRFSIIRLPMSKFPHFHIGLFLTWVRLILLPLIRAMCYILLGLPLLRQQ
jgi:hypothetical protein